MAFPSGQNDFCLCTQYFVHSTQFPQHVSACVLLCSQSCMRECFICDTIAALPELMHRCQNQHMLSSYTCILSKLLSLTVFYQGGWICTVSSCVFCKLHSKLTETKSVSHTYAQLTVQLLHNETGPLILFCLGPHVLLQHLLFHLRLPPLCVFPSPSL